MRDPMTWSVPFFRAFGIPVKVHVLFFLVAAGMALRQISRAEGVPWLDVVLFDVALLFGVILLHEFGHCFGGRAVGGEATEILIWPLGGLASVDVPHHWKAHTITVAAGPAVNLGVCAVTAAVLGAAGFIPTGPLGNPYVSEMRNYHDGHTYAASPYAARPAPADHPPPAPAGEAADRSAAGERYQAPTWAVWTNRAFWLSWVLFLFNLLPAYPLDGGQLLQGLVWWRTDYRQGTTVACYAGFGVSLLFFVAAVWQNETLLMGLSLFMFFSSATRLQSVTAEDGLYGEYPTAYGGADDDDTPAPRRRKANPLKRWLQARTARRLQREVEERQRDDERMDTLLEKIQRAGKASLTDEEKRFMARVSERYRNRS